MSKYILIPIAQQSIILKPGQIKKDDQIQSIASSQSEKSKFLLLDLHSNINQTANVLQKIFPTLHLPRYENKTNSLSQLQHYKIKDEPEENADDKNICLNTIKCEEQEINTIKCEEQDITIEYTPIAKLDSLELNRKKLRNVYLLPKPCNSITDRYRTLKPLKCRTILTCGFPGCSVVLPSLYEKKLHMEAHMFPINVKYKCNICNMAFDFAAVRNKHVETHTVMNTYQCQNCNETFPYYTTLVNHLKDKKCLHAKSISCNHCGGEFVNDNDFDRHKQFNMKCNICLVKICNKQVFELHRMFCKTGARKRKINRSTNTKKKKKISDNSVIVID